MEICVYVAIQMKITEQVLTGPVLSFIILQGGFNFFLSRGDIYYGTIQMKPLSIISCDTVCTSREKNFL